MKRVKIFDPKKNRWVHVGNIQGNTFIRKVNKSHFVYKYKGYGLQIEVFDKIKKVEWVDIMVKDGVYRAKLSDWIEHGVADDLGHGIQRFLPVERMTFHDDKT